MSSTTAAEVSMMNPQGLQTMAKDRAQDHVKPQPGKDTAQKPPVESIATKVESSIVPQYLRREQNQDAEIKSEQKKGVEITTSTKVTAGDVLVNQYQAIKEVMKTKGADLTAPPLKEFANFINTFETSYLKEKKATIGESNPTEDELKAFARGLMNTEDTDKYMLWAIKIAESQQAVIQAVTSARVEVLADKDESEYIPELRAHGPNSMEDVTDEHLAPKAEGWFTQILNKGKILVGKRKTPLPIERASPKARAVEARLKAARRAEAQKPIQTVELVSIRNPKVNLQNTIEGKPLDDVQKAFLKRFDFLGTKTYQDATLNAASQREISVFLGRITDARMNFYAHLGDELYSTGVDDFNVVKTRTNNRLVTPKSNDFIYGSFGRNDRIVLDSLGFPQVGGQSREVMVGVGGVDLKHQLEIIETGLLENLKPVLENRQTEKIQKAMDFQMSQLRADLYEGNKPKPKDPKTVREINESTGENGLPFWEKKQELLQSRIDKENEKKQLQDQIRAIDSQLDTDSSVIDKSTNKAYTYSEIHANFLQAEQERDTSQQRVEELEKELTDATAQHAELEARINSPDAAISGAVTPAEHTTFNNLATRINGDPANNLKSLTELIDEQKAELERKTEELEKAKETYPKEIREQIDSWIDAKSEHEKNILVKDSELIETNAIIADALKKNPNDPNSTEYTLQELQEKINALIKRREIAEQPHRFKAMQLEVYQELKERTETKTYADMRNRAAESMTDARIKDVEDAMLIHPNYPPAYLRALQIIYTENITEPQAAEAFAKATRLLPMDVFIKALQDKGISITGSQDARLRDFNLVNKVDKQFISAVMNDLLQQARTGDLGKVSEQDQAALEAIDIIPATNLESYRTKQDTQIDRAVDKAAIATVGKDKIKASLQNVGGIDVDQAADDLKDSLNRSRSKDDAAQIFARKHNLTNPQAADIVEKVYSLYGEQNAAIGRSADVMETSLRQGRGLEEAVTLAATLLMIKDPAERQIFLSYVEQGKTQEQIFDAYSKLSPSGRPKFFRDYEHLHNMIEILQSNANHTQADFKREIGAAIDMHKRNEHSLSLGVKLPQAVEEEVMRFVQLIDILAQKQQSEMYINDMNKKILTEGSVDEMTLMLLTMHNQSISSEPAVRMQKMVATEIKRRRDLSKRRTQAPAPVEQ